MKDFDDNREPAATNKRKLAKISPLTNAHGREQQHVMVPVGLKWKENSCTFDAMLTILYNIWQMNSDLWSAQFHSLSLDAVYSLSPGFQAVLNGVTELDDVHDTLHREIATLEDEFTWER